MHKSILAAAVTLALAFALPAAAQSGSTTVMSSPSGNTVVSTAPGVGVMGQTFKTAATITKINAKTREVTLKGPQGREVTIVAGPEVKNFKQLKVGQKVEAEYGEALVLELKKGGGKQVARTERVVEKSAKPGEMPAGAAGREVKVVGDVIGLDPATRRVTVRGPHQTVDLHLQDPEQFKLISKGDQIEATYTEAIAVSVVAAKK